MKLLLHAAACASVLLSSSAEESELVLLQRTARVSRVDMLQDFTLNETAHRDIVIVTDPPLPSTAAQAAGVTENGPADLGAFESALMVNVITFFICIFIFMDWRFRYPIVFSNNVKIGIAPTACIGSTEEEVSAVLDTRWGWWTAAIAATSDDAMDATCDAVGLDVALLLEFVKLSKRIMMYIGVPMICILGPINMLFGGHPAEKANDYMSIISFGNIENGSKLYWMHAFTVWFVVIVVIQCVYSAQSQFVDMRYRWLRGQSTLQATTVLVDGIPDEYRSDAKLKEFFATIFQAENIEKAVMTKNTNAFAKLEATKAATTDALEINKAKWKLTATDENPDGDPEQRPKTMFRKDAIEEAENTLKETEEQLEEERKILQNASTEVAGVNRYSGFVTFKDRKFAQMASTQQYSRDRDQWVVCSPPEPSDIRWSDLQLSPYGQQGWSVLGYGCVVGLYFAYTPLVIGISQCAGSVDLGPLQSVWAGLAPTLGLTVMVSFLPTILNTIFNAFFVLKADIWSQKRLQTYYFYFQVVFVVLVPAIGANVEEFTLTLFTDPLGLPDLLGSTMPGATHFFMNFMVLQWVAHAMNIMRYTQLFKYLGFQKLYDEETAHKKAEPEDQDYYGIGSRTARFQINLVIGIVYGTLSPPVNLLTWINFYICLGIYGYLIPFAESKKPDLGGAFWVDQLRQTFVALIIYCVVMIGVLSGRMDADGGFSPTYIAAPALIYVVWAYRRFDAAFSWEELPLVEAAGAAPKTQRTLKGEYVQPELSKLAQ